VNVVVVDVPTCGGLVGDVPQSTRYLDMGRPPGAAVQVQVNVIEVFVGAVAEVITGAGGIGSVLVETMTEGGELSTGDPESEATTSQ